jgi:6-phosphogluconolactonase (cycloisomerase 2 family)
MKQPSIASRILKLVVIGIALTGVAASSISIAAPIVAGYVYVMTNKTDGNSIVSYARNTDGSLTKLQEVFTGGLGGTGNGVPPLDPLGSEDSLILTGAGSRLIAVNAGSNSLTSLTASGGVLQAVSPPVDSGGLFPNSVAVHDDLVYVLNAHTPNVVGFRLAADGSLNQITGSAFAVPGGTAGKPHDIRFSPDGTRLLVAVDVLNEIDVFSLDESGLVSGVKAQASAGSGPFGMRFGRGGVLLNAEANSGSASTYTLNADDTLTVISGAVPDTQAASCWVSLTRDGKFAFVSNTASGTISVYQISGNGSLSLEAAVAASLSGGAPIDSALSSDGSFLYVQDSAQGRVFIFAVHGASLHPIGMVSGLPQNQQGIAAQ